MDTGAQHVVVVAHDDALFCIHDLPLVALDIEHNPRVILLVFDHGRTVRAALEFIVRHCEEGASQRIGKGNAGSVGVNQSANRRFLLRIQSRRILWWIKRIHVSLLKPCFPVIRLRCEIFLNIAGDISICTWITDQGVIHIIGLLVPRIKDHFFVSIIRMQGGHNTLDRIIEQDGAYPDFFPIPEIVAIVKERLVLSYRLAFVVENRPAGSNPTRIDNWSTVLHCPRFGRDLRLNLTFESVRIRETDLDLQPACRHRTADVCFTGDGRSKGRPVRVACQIVAVHIIYDASGSRAQPLHSLASGVGKKVIDLLLCEICLNTL